MSIKTIFLDRDGVINKDVNYAYKIVDFEFIEGLKNLEVTIGQVRPLLDLKPKTQLTLFKKIQKNKLSSRQVENEVKKYKNLKPVQTRDNSNKTNNWDELIGIYKINLSNYLKDENLQIILIGDGPEKDKLKNFQLELNLENISFIAPQKRELIPELLASADIGLVCLKKYIPGAVPSKMYEAMSSGLPIIMIGEGEPSEIVSNNNCGISIRPGEPIEIANVIKKLANDSTLRKTMGQNSRKTAISEYNRNIILNKFYKYLEKNSNN